MKVLVVGASGVLGRSLVPRLVGAGHAVRALSRRPLAAAAGVEPLAGDLLASDLAPLVDGCEAVIHAATAIPSDPTVAGAWDMNTRLRTLGARRLVAACEAAGVKRYVQQSITMAYADGGDSWLDESAAFDASPARVSVVEPVREMELLVRSSSLDWRIGRAALFAGPGTGQDALLEGLAARTAVVPCDGAFFVSLVHPADVASACVLALGAPSASRSVYNLVGEVLRHADYVDRLAASRGLPLARRDASRACPASQRVSAELARQQLAWRPTHSIWPDPVDILRAPSIPVQPT